MLLCAKVAAVVLASAALVTGQSERACGPARSWWEPHPGGVLSWEESHDNPTGEVTLVNRNGPVRREGHPFSKALGRSGRTCVSCHQPAHAMGVSTAASQGRWKATDGHYAVFAAVDRSNCPSLPQNEAGSYALLLNSVSFASRYRGRRLSGRNFASKCYATPEVADNHAQYGLGAASPAVSVYRCLTIAANLEYVIRGPKAEAFMADGREPHLASQARNAILIQEEAAAPPSAEQLRQIVAPESGLFAAQRADIRAGLLDEEAGPVLLGPQNLAEGHAPALGAASAAKVLESFESWRAMTTEYSAFQLDFRTSVTRGATSSSGALSLSARAPNQARVPLAMRPAPPYGWTAEPPNGTPAEAIPELPLFRVTCAAAAAPHSTLGGIIYTQGPGRALISGRCADVGAIVVPQFRGLAARAPYFSNASARDLGELIEFYDREFQIGYTPGEKQDLLHFLGAR